MRPVLLEVRNVGEGARLRLAKGDLVAILGPPGAGKSKFLRILAFLEPPESGDLLWQGRLVTGTAAGRLPVTLLDLPKVLQPPPDCELLLLDEPARELMPGLLPLTQSGMAVLVATDDPEVAVWCEIIYRLKDGRLRRLDAEI